TGWNEDSQNKVSKAMAKRIWLKPTTATLAGGPAAKALVRNSWPMVAEMPTPRSSKRVSDVKVSRKATARPKRKSDAKQKSVDTAEKCATIAQLSICCRRCSPIMATAVEKELPRAIREAKLPSAKCGCCITTMPSIPPATESQTRAEGDSPKS